MITFFALIAFYSNVDTQEDVKIIKATYDGYENEIYTFIDSDKETYYFNRMDAAVKEKFDLTGLDFVGDNFEISYKIGLEETKTDKKEIVHIILNLNLVK